MTNIDEEFEYKEYVNLCLLESKECLSQYGKEWKKDYNKMKGFR